MKIFEQSIIYLNIIQKFTQSLLLNLHTHTLQGGLQGGFNVRSQIIRLIKKKWIVVTMTTLRLHSSPD